jgi:hypothetical protein
MTTATIAAPFTIAQITQALPGRVMKLLSLKGQFASITFERSLKVKKGVAPVTKRTQMVVRLGVEYDNQQIVQDKREEGALPSENQGLNGVEWIAYPYLLRSLKTGKFQVRVAPNRNAEQKPKVAFIRNGEEITREQAAEGAYASEFAEREAADAFNLTVDNIKMVNGEEV